MKRLSFLCLLCLLTSCGPLLKSKYEPPQIMLPPSWQHGSGVIEDEETAWWTRFNDPILDKLIQDVLAQNNDLAAAALDMKKARLEADLAFNQYLPDVSSALSYSDQHRLSGSKTRTRNYGSSLTVGYELDLWGKLARDLEAAEWEATASEADWQSAAIELVATTMQLYWKLGYLNERITSSENSIAYAEKTLELVDVKHQAGATSALEILAAQQNLAKQKAAHQQFLQEKTEAQNAFNILFNSPPEIERVDPQTLTKSAIPTIAENAPALLLHKRPDIRAAETRLRKVLAEADSTLSSYLPSFSLTGNLGSSSVSLKDVLTNPIGTLGAGITLPFLNWYDMRKNVRISDVTYEQAVINFRQTLFRALADVEDALAARQHDLEKGQELQKILHSAQEAEDLHKLRYTEGYNDLQSWLDAQESRRSAEISALENRYDQLIDALTLYKALGGSDRL